MAEKKKKSAAQPAEKKIADAVKTVAPKEKGAADRTAPVSVSAAQTRKKTAAAQPNGSKKTERPAAEAQKTAADRGGQKASVSAARAKATPSSPGKSAKKTASSSETAKPKTDRAAAEVAAEKSDAVRNGAAAPAQKAEAQRKPANSAEQAAVPVNDEVKAPKKRARRPAAPAVPVEQPVAEPAILSAETEKPAIAALASEARTDALPTAQTPIQPQTAPIADDPDVDDKAAADPSAVRDGIAEAMISGQETASEQESAAEKTKARKERGAGLFARFSQRKKQKNLPPVERVDSDADTGLTAEQVAERVDRGATNSQPNIITKSYFSIFRSNVFTLFNLINFFLATLILIYGEIKNALFMGIVFCNMVVGIVQEIRSKHTLEKLSILNAPSIEVVRGGRRQEIAVDDIVIDDVIVLKQGAQIPADSVLIRGECEVNESLLTGEQDDVHKEEGSALLSGSFVQAGSCLARVNAVGEENFASKLMAEAKKFKKTKSELMKSINWIIRIVTILIFPVGILMFFTNKNTMASMSGAVTASVASVVGMIPEGLVVLTSLALAVGIIKLARKRTLVQDLYCIETLARVDVLCLDKTGTITEGSMQVEDTCLYAAGSPLAEIMANMVAALGDSGASFAAFKEYFRGEAEYRAVKTIPFSSARKWSAADFGADGRYIVGAPEFVLKSRYHLVAADAERYANDGMRVLVLVKTSEELNERPDETLMEPVALIVLSDKIRENAKETFEFFARQGVTLKVISGDNPVTVSKVAERAGLAGADKYIDASVDLDTEEKIFDACDKYTIFGRVSPKQKKMLVSSLKKKGFTVGMTGDGVNDVMALKEADCSIAMASGSEASRNVAQLVLLDSDFSSLPSVVAEGRRVINNIERAASLFLVKTTFSILLSVVLIIFQMNYPFVPIQLTLISSLFVGIPSFFLALEPNDTKVTGNFLGKVFKKALPAGLTVTLMLSIVSFMYRDIGIDVSAQVSTMSLYLTAVVAFFVLVQVCMPYNKERVFLVAICLLLFVICISSGWIGEILSVVPLTTDMIVKVSIMIAVILPAMLFMRAEVEAFGMLYKEVSGFFVNVYKRAKGFIDKRRQMKGK